MASEPKVVGPGPKPTGQYLAHYKLVREIGRGGMGMVYQGYEEALQRPVAIKVLDEKYANDKEFVAKFYQEAQAVAALNHPHIVQIYFIGQQDRKIFFAMEYIDGQDVFDLLRQSGKLTVPDALEIIRQTAQGLDYAQRYGIIHRDIKPSNLMITNKGVVKIADFGLAKELVRTEGSEEMGILMGTPEYVSPELAQGEQGDQRTDIYSLGATFYNLVCGHPPYQSVTAAAILQRHLQDPVPNASADNPQVSPAVSALIARMMAKKPHERYQNYTELLADIDEIIAQGLAIAPLSPEKGQAAPKTDRRISVHRAAHVAAGLVPTPATHAAPVEAEVERTPVLPPLYKGILAGGALLLVILIIAIVVLWHSRKSSDGTPVAPPRPVQNVIPPPQNPVPPPAPVTSPAVEGVPLDMTRACNAELILTPTHKPSDRLEIGSPLPLSLASASASARSTGSGDFGLPDDRKISIPTSTRYSGSFLLTPYEGPSAIVLSTAPNSGSTRVELELIPAQQQAYRALLFLHASSGGDGQILVTLQYEGSHTQSFRLDLFDGRTLAQATHLFLPAHSAVVLREKSADAFSPLGVFASDTGQKMGNAGFLGQAITNLDESHRLQKIIFSRPLATSSPRHPGAVSPEQDKFQAAIFGINAVPVHPNEWQAAKAKEDQFSAATAPAAQLAVLHRFPDARNLYEKMAAESPADSYPNLRARWELDRLKTAQRIWEYQHLFDSQRENAATAEALLNFAEKQVKNFQFEAAAKKIVEDIAKISAPALIEPLARRLADMKRLARLHQRLVDKINRGGVTANWPLLNGSTLTGLVQKADETGVWIGNQCTRWQDLKAAALDPLYRGVVDETQAETLVDFALLCLEQQPRQWEGAAESLEKAEKLDPALAPVITVYRNRLLAIKRGEKGGMYLPNLPLRRLSELVLARRWEAAKVALDRFKKELGDSSGLTDEEKAFAADLAQITENQYNELVATRREAQSVARNYQWIAHRRAEMIRAYGRVVTVRADGSGQFQTIQAAVDSNSENFAIEVGTGRYPESITLKGKKHMAIFGHREMPVVCDKLNVADDCLDVTIDGLVFPAGTSEALQVGRATAKGIARTTIRYCAFLGRGIHLNNCGAATITDCVFLKRGLRVDGLVVLEARHNLFADEAIRLAPGQTTLFDNIFVPQNEAWVLSDSPKPDFVSDYNFVQTNASGTFARAQGNQSSQESFAHLNDWQLKTQQDKHSSESSGSNFKNPVNGDYSLKPDSSWQGKASDKYAPGPRWAPSQWIALAQVL